MLSYIIHFFICMLIRPIYVGYHMMVKEINLSGRHFHFLDQAVVNYNKTMPVI